MACSWPAVHDDVRGGGSAEGVTLSALTNRMAVAPASKFSEEMRAALPEGLRGMLDWELPPAQQQEEGKAPGPKL